MLMCEPHVMTTMHCTVEGLTHTNDVSDWSMTWPMTWPGHYLPIAIYGQVFVCLIDLANRSSFCVILPTGTHSPQIHPAAKPTEWWFAYLPGRWLSSFNLTSCVWQPIRHIHMVRIAGDCGTTAPALHCARYSHQNCNANRWLAEAWKTNVENHCDVLKENWTLSCHRHFTIYTALDILRLGTV